MTTELTVALISSLFTAVIGPIAVYITKEQWGKRKKKDIIQESLLVNNLITHKLEEIKEQTKVDRVWITRFHNGGNFYPSGKSIQKFSMFYENINPNIDSIQQSFQNIPVSLFNKSVNDVFENNITVIPDFKDDTANTYGLRHIAEQNGCKSGYLFAIKTIDNRFIGILGLDYVKKKTQLTNDELNAILVEASLIGGVLKTK